jgi:hypothetical protein
MMKILDKFDPYAMVAPKTPEDITLLLQEALNVANDIDDILSQVAKDCQKDIDSL